MWQSLFRKTRHDETRHYLKLPFEAAFMRRKSFFLKQKLRLYFDENFPTEVVRHFYSSSFWRKKLTIVSAHGEKNLKACDSFHYTHCRRKGYTLVTLDSDFNNDRHYPFGSGQMAGMIIVKVSPSDHPGIVAVLTSLLKFLLWLPFPKDFLRETKFIVDNNGAVMRGRDTLTREIKSLRIIAGETTIREVRHFFSY